MKNLSHFDGQGKARMVDVSFKSQTQREAVAQARILISPQTQKLIRENKIIKGDVLTVAKIAGIMAAKKVAGLIPMAHTLIITHCHINFDIFKDGIIIEATTRIKALTGVEMEA
ncbi:MAG: cyclic pyranopterin monophosphate synthase MoaC, partial [Candidatus Omnitrophica bacterium]|nr:cyclic pyranopterin monophosphate synthase MoaC [Candidatus Omnitrophota bacterium]